MHKHTRTYTNTHTYTQASAHYMCSQDLSHTNTHKHTSTHFWTSLCLMTNTHTNTHTHTHLTKMSNKSTHTSGFFSLFAYLNIASRFKQHEAHLEAGQRPKARRSEKNHVGNCSMKRVDRGDDESKRRASEASSAQGLACRIERPSSSSSRARSNPKRRVRRAARSRPWRAAGKDQGGEKRGVGQALVALLA